MKRIQLIAIMLLISICSFAQHLTFGGIPINGTINQFQQKLAQKGYKISRINAELKLPNTRVFDGKYCGQNVSLYVSYVPSSKTVYEVKVSFNDEQEGVVTNYLETVKQSIRQKYGDLYVSGTGKSNMDDDTDIFYIYDKNDVRLGDITIGYHYFSEHYYDSSYLGIIIYTDQINAAKMQSSNLDDI